MSDEQLREQISLDVAIQIISGELNGVATFNREHKQAVEMALDALKKLKNFPALAKEMGYSKLADIEPQLK